MEYFVQQLVNGLTLGSIYGLIAIGYTMVYGIIGMINFAHGDIFMLGGFAALITFLVLTSVFVGLPVVILLLVMIAAAMLTASLWNWTIEKVAYRPLRGSFRLAPLITAIGMSIALSNFIQVTQGPRNKPIPPLVSSVYNVFGIAISLKQIIIMLLTVILLTTSLYNWTIEKVAYRPLRGSFRLAPLISAIGMSIVLQEFVRIAQGARPKPMPPRTAAVKAFTPGTKPSEKATTP